MGKNKILIVDDKKANVYSLRELLKNDNTIIFEAYSGEECLSILLKNSVDLVLMDIQMPKMDGFETAKYLLDNEKTKYIPIIFVTAASKTDQFNLRGYENGAVDVIYKPIDETILKSKVSIFLEIAANKAKLEEQVRLLTKLNYEKEQLAKEIEKIAMQDYLTEISNRRKLDTDLKKLYRDAYRNKYSISVLMIDLDNFKGYNDYYGHIQGDQALKSIAKVIDKSIQRPLDTCGRFGGEEFVVILPKTNEGGAETMAEKIRKGVLDLKIKHCPKCEQKYLSISLGVASTIPQEYSNEQMLVDQSDKALYKAKNSGKNKFITYNAKIT